ncbi:hypothetical protein PG988_005969 [Apiospora saccharicola]
MSSPRFLVSAFEAYASSSEQRTFADPLEAAIESAADLPESSGSSVSDLPEELSRSQTEDDALCAPLGIKIASIRIATRIGKDKVHSITGGVVVQIGPGFYQMTLEHSPERLSSIWSQSDPSEASVQGSVASTELPQNHHVSLPLAEEPKAEGQTEPGEPQHQGRHVQIVSEDLAPILRGIESDEKLDYVLLPLDGHPNGATRVYLHGQPTLDDRTLVNKALSITSLLKIPSLECPIIAVTASSGAVSGTSFPGAAFLRAAGSTCIQKIYAVDLDTNVAKGDCGSVVVDPASGGLYGHIVRGYPGTGLAYILSAETILDDIKRRFGTDEVSLWSPSTVTPAEDEGDAGLEVGAIDKGESPCKTPSDI